MTYDRKEIKEDEGKEIEAITTESSVKYVDNVLEKLCEFIKNKEIPDEFCWCKNVLQRKKELFGKDYFRPLITKILSIVKVMKKSQNCLSI